MTSSLLISGSDLFVVAQMNPWSSGSNSHREFRVTTKDQGQRTVIVKMYNNYNELSSNEVIVDFMT
jgi:hypothetical protein